jgi:hypothetical protein
MIAGFEIASYVMDPPVYPVKTPILANIDLVLSIKKGENTL